MDLKVIKKGSFEYIEEGEGEVIVLLHGLLGSLTNFSKIIPYFASTHRLILPILPVTELPLRQTSIAGLTNYVMDFINFLELDNFILVGNSLGGHLAINYLLEYSHKVSALILTGSSGLFENTFGTSFPKRKDYQFIKEKTEFTFYSPKTATKELVDNVFESTSKREKALRIVMLAKSAMRESVEESLPNILLPTLLIWGKQDRITPPFVGEDFKRLIPNSELYFIDECGHAPMLEQPLAFSKIMRQFINKRSHAPELTQF
ncbi:MAG: alpha/beta fold hydrolase [Chitinophagales bacterium]